MNRFILHCDLDCFFASVEMRDNPSLKGKPVIIGADPKEGKGRGVVATCNYEARKSGLHSAMPISQAYKLCPRGEYLKPSHRKYSSVSRNVMQILEEYTDLFQQVSIDEAYMDVSEHCKNFNDAKALALKIKNKIFEKIGITCSIGCSNTKSIAKIASDFNKPNGICVVQPDEVKDFLKDMDITKIPGIGKKSKRYYNKKGITKIGDLMEFSLPQIIEMFGKNGKWVWKVINGLDNRRVREFPERRKSISKERTFYEDTNDFEKILSKLVEIDKKIHEILLNKQMSYRTITLKLRFENFETFTRSKSLTYPICDKKRVLKIVLNLYEEFAHNPKKVRLIGIKLSNLESTPKIKQMNLLEFTEVIN